MPNPGLIELNQNTTVALLYYIIRSRSNVGFGFIRSRSNVGFGFLDLTGRRGLILLPGCLMWAPGDNVSNIAFGYSGCAPVSLEPRAAQRKLV